MLEQLWSTMLQLDVPTQLNLGGCGKIPPHNKIVIQTDGIPCSKPGLSDSTHHKLNHSIANAIHGDKLSIAIEILIIKI